MAALVHVKRRIEEDPLNAFILNCKIRKVDDHTSSSCSSKDSKETEATTIVKYAGTFDNQETILNHVKDLTKETAKEILSKVRTPISAIKNRREYKKNCQESRFKIINCYRSLNSSDEKDSSQIGITVVEVEKELPTIDNDSIVNTTSNSNYVYDLYFAERNPSEPDIEMDNLVSISVCDELLFDTYRDDGYINSSDNESEDSNNENNWRNEYPDTEDDDDDDDDASSINERQIRRAIDEFDLDDERALSSDAEDEMYLCHSIDTTNESFEPDIDSFDVRNYGKAYAKYKARALEMYKDNDDDDDDNNDDDDKEENCSDDNLSK